MAKQSDLLPSSRRTASHEQSDPTVSRLFAEQTPQHPRRLADEVAGEEAALTPAELASLAAQRLEQTLPRAHNFADLAVSAPRRQGSILLQPAPVSQPSSSGDLAQAVRPGATSGQHEQEATGPATIGAPGDHLEQEAEQIAAAVAAEDAGAPRVPVQRAAASSAVPAGAPAPPGVARQIRALQGGGSPLDRATRGFMEPRLGHDFARVRVHADAPADQLSRAIQARAFTAGQDVFFRQGEYRPERAEGRRLIAHELTHVVQQSRSEAPSGAADRIQRNNDDSDDELLSEVSDQSDQDDSDDELLSEVSDQSDEDEPGSARKRKRDGEDDYDEGYDDPRSVKRDKVILIDAEYWLRSVIRPGTDGARVKAQDAALGRVRIADKRRATAQEPAQGDHLVAWAAMVEFWSQELSHQRLEDALLKLQAWLLKDQIYDKELGGSPDDEDKRVVALTLVQTALQDEGTLDLKMVQFELIVSLFVEANQHSKFATIGKASGGHGEADARAKLAARNQMEEDEDDQMEDNPKSEKVDDGKAEAEPGDQPESVTSLALTLLDIGKVDKDLIIEKAVASWYEMLSSTYHNLYERGEFAELEKYKIREKTVSEWVAAAEKSYNSAKDAFYKGGKLIATSANVPSDPLGTPVPTLVSANLAAPAEASAAYGAAEVKLAYLEVPDVRAETQYGNRQGAHTVAWTFKRQALEHMFRGRTCAEALQMISALVKSDAEDLDTSGGFPAPIRRVKAKHKALQEHIAFAQKESLELDQWKRLLEGLLGLYVEANQLLPATTYYGAFNPTGHGEGKVNETFGQADPYVKATHYDVLAKSAPRLVDLGVLYLPLLTDVSNYNTYRKLGDPLKEGNTNALDKVIKDTASAATTGAETRPVDEIFGDLLAMKNFKYKKVGDLIRDLPLDTFDSLARSLDLLREYLSKPELNQEDPLDRLALTDAKMLPHAQKFAEEIRTLAKEKINAKQRNLVKRLEGLLLQITNYRNKSPAVRNAAARRQKALYLALDGPKKYFDDLYTAKKGLIKKIIGEYWHHLPHYHPEFFNDLQGDAQTKEEILTTIFLGPLELKDDGIGQPIKIHLTDAYQQFIVPFRAAIATKASSMVADLMPAAEAPRAPVERP